jgi:hypothetical protein
MTLLTESIRNAPFASISPAEAESFASMLRTSPEALAELLDNDASTHEMCDNWTKAGVLRNLAKRVRAHRVR